MSRTHWAVFRMTQTENEEEPFSVPPEECIKVAAWMRHATAQALEGEGGWDLNGYVLGHPAAGQDRSHRLSYVPLPSVGPNRDGRIRRVAVVEPAGADGTCTALLRNQLNGRLLVNPRGRAMCRLAEAAERDEVQGYFLGPDGGSRTWETVTPVILHGHDRLRGKVVPRRAEKLLRQALAECGVDVSAASLEMSRRCLAEGLPDAEQLILPRHLREWPRYHVRIKLKDALPGPILVGIGRHYGVGVFATGWGARAVASGGVVREQPGGARVLRTRAL